jgi:hypothetical protein
MTTYRPFAVILKATALTVFLVGITPLHAQEPGKLDLEAVEVQVTQVIGLRVFAGIDEVGIVSDVSLDGNGQIDKIRVRTASPLGFGERFIEIHAPAFMLLHEAVVLDLSASEVDQIPSANEVNERTQDAAEK